MAGVGEEETEYESDPEEVKMSLKMRRREASDDEEEREETKSVGDGTGSDAGSEGQGGAADYDDGELEEEEYYDEEEDEEVVEEEYGEDVGRVHGEGEVPEAMGRDGDAELGEGHGQDGQSQLGEEEKKESEPFAVPKAGAFYMHDDRFSDNVAGRRRRGGRRLWESRDEKKWGHDKFEEMDVKDRHYIEGRRSSRGRARGRGRGRGSDRGYGGGDRSRPYTENNNLNIAPKTVRGRGPRRYQALAKGENEAPLSHNKQSQRYPDKASYAGSGRIVTSAPHVDLDPVPPKRVASNLNSASPPFYPSGTSSKDNAGTPKRDDQTANANRNICPPMNETLPMKQSNSSFRGKNVVDSVGMERLYIDTPPLAGPMGNVHLPSASLSSNDAQSRGQGRGTISGSNSFLTSVENQVTRTSSAAQTRQGNHVQGLGQASLPVSVQQSSVHRLSSVSQSSSPSQAGLLVTTSESGDVDSLTDLSKSKTAMVAMGKGNSAGSGRGPLLFNGAQLMGSGGTVGAGRGDQNFPATPAFLPVMQFGAQHPGGVGVPAVGMAFPGYVGQPQNGLGNSEMTWLPVLTGPAGALGAGYYPPYISVDGSYHARPAGQMPALAASSKENDANKPNNELKTQQKPDLVNDEVGQRQNKPRRYSEMKFGQ